MSKYEDGICPCCGAEIEYKGPYDYDGIGATLPFRCPTCGASGEAGYTFVFDGYYNVEDKNGRGVELES